MCKKEIKVFRTSRVCYFGCMLTRIICVFLFCSQANGKHVDFTVNFDECKKTQSVMDAKSYHDLMLNILSLQIYTTKIEDIKDLMQKCGFPLRVENIKSKGSYSVLAYALPKTSDDKEVCKAVFFLFRDNQLLSLSYTELSTLLPMKMRFSNFNEMNWNYNKGSYPETHRLQDNNWNEWIFNTLSQFEELSVLNMKKTLTHFNLQDAELHVMHHKRKMCSALSYMNEDDEDEDAEGVKKTPYLFLSYPYVRCVVLLYANNKLQSINCGMEIQPCVLPEDGSEDPLNIVRYVLIIDPLKVKKNKKK